MRTLLAFAMLLSCFAGERTARAAAESCALSARDLKPHDARRGEALLGSLTFLVLAARLLRSRPPVGRPSQF